MTLIVVEDRGSPKQNIRLVEVEPGQPNRTVATVYRSSVTEKWEVYLECTSDWYLDVEEPSFETAEAAIEAATAGYVMWRLDGCPHSAWLTSEEDVP